MDKNPSSDLLYKLEDFLGTQIEGRNFERKPPVVQDSDFGIAKIQEVGWEVEVEIEAESSNLQPGDADQLE